jgi:hypothetical protein
VGLRCVFCDLGQSYTPEERSTLLTMTKGASATESNGRRSSKQGSRCQIQVQGQAGLINSGRERERERTQLRQKGT